MKNENMIAVTKAGRVVRIAAFSAVGAFFNLGLTPEIARAVAEGPVFQEHAKEPGRPFNADAQRAQHIETGALHGEELMRTKDWARALARRCNAPLTLEETLRP